MDSEKKNFEDDSLIEKDEAQQTDQADLSESEIQAILEAVLFTASEPISVSQLRSVFDRAISGHAIRAQLRELGQFYDQHQRSFQILEIANGFQICTRPDYAAWIEKFHTRQVRVKLTPSALETLAIVAYKQPVTRLEIEEIRGVNSDSVLNSLIEKGLVRISGRKQEAGRALLFSSSNQFLEQFGLKNLSDLPSVEEIQEILDQSESDLNND
ncbi:MAG: SMC-Scp complex subunit ScpB [Candidatus Poribacteria bacterium]|jgi:segregation and condensation protein B|nr:SMC-Scp complex subunit ScpB [Candidatus Poribacteria bacterium]MDP6994805.1 SMC-Scp complex subunit ScpB [Candidatus Poribacteria bacterium]